MSAVKQCQPTAHLKIHLNHSNETEKLYNIDYVRFLLDGSTFGYAMSCFSLLGLAILIRCCTDHRLRERLESGCVSEPYYCYGYEQGLVYGKSKACSPLPFRVLAYTCTIICISAYSSMYKLCF